MLCLTISDIAIITVNNFDYRGIMYNISKSKAIHSLEIFILEDSGFHGLLNTRPYISHFECQN